MFDRRPTLFRRTPTRCDDGSSKGRALQGNLVPVHSTKRGARLRVPLQQQRRLQSLRATSPAHPPCQCRRSLRRGRRPAACRCPRRSRTSGTRCPRSRCSAAFPAAPRAWTSCCSVSGRRRQGGGGGGGAEQGGGGGGTGNSRQPRQESAATGSMVSTASPQQLIHGAADYATVPQRPALFASTMSSAVSTACTPFPHARIDANVVKV